MSTYMHDTLAVGGVVQLSPPFGPFNLQSGGDNEKKAVLISAGIGRTPMKSFLDALTQAGVSTTKTVHVDKNQASVPFYDHFESVNAGNNQYYFTQNGGRPSTEDIAKSLVEETGADCMYYICGPTSFMQGMAHALVASGVQRGDLKWEAFSPQLSCPV